MRRRRQSYCLPDAKFGIKMPPAIHLFASRCATLDALNRRKTEEASNRNKAFIQSEPELDAQE